MAFTKIRGPAGITTTDNYRVGVITATKFVGPFDGVVIGGDGINVSGIVTATGLDINGNADISGNLTVHGDSTTLNTTLREVELLHVDANASVTAGIITQRGSGDILNLFDTTTEVFTVLDGGKVGIKTDNPGHQLDGASDLVIGNVGEADSGMTFVSATNGQSLIHFSDAISGNARYDGFIGYEQTDRFLKFGTAQAERLRIDASGRIGINNSAPLYPMHFKNAMGSSPSWIHMEVTGSNTTGGGGGIAFDTSATNSTSNNGIFLATISGERSASANGSNTLVFKTSKANVAGDGSLTSGPKTQMVITEDGKLGLGVASPASESGWGNILHINSASAGAHIRFTDNTSGSGAGDGSYIGHYGNDTYLVNKESSGVIIFNTNANERLRIDASGNTLVNVNTATAGSYTYKLLSSDNISSSEQTFGIQYPGVVTYGLNAESNADFTIKKDGTERLRIDSDGNILLKDAAGQGNSLVHYIKATDSGGNPQYQLGMLSSGNQDLYIENSKSANIRIRTNGSTRWKIDGDPGHLLPETAGAVDIGSTSAEIGNVYLADDKKAFFGSSQDLEIYHAAGADSIIHHTATSGTTLRLRSRGFTFKNQANNGTIATLNEGDACTLFFSNTARIATSNKGVTVTGEVAATQDYPNFRPTLDFNFAAVKKLDSIIEYRRTGPASYIDDLGLVKLVGPNVPRFDHDPVTKECKGLLVEEIRTNHISYSEEISRANNSGVTITNNNAISPDGTQNASRIVGSGSDTNTNINWSTQTVTSGHYGTWSIFVKSTETSCILQFYTNTFLGGANRVNVELADGTTGGDAVNGNTWFWKVEEYPNSWWRVSWGGTGGGSAGGMHIGVVPAKTSARGATSGSAVNKTYYAWGIQEEHGSGQNYATSYMRTNGASAARGADIVTIEGEEFTDFYNKKEGTLFLSASYTEDIRASAIVVIDDTSNESEYTEVGYRAGGGSSGAVASYIRTDAGNDQYYKNYASSATQGNEFKVALAYKDDDYASSVNGQTVHTDTSGTTSKVYDRLRFSDVDTVGVVGSGHYRRFMYYSKRLSNNQVVTLTS